MEENRKKRDQEERRNRRKRDRENAAEDTLEALEDDLEQETDEEEEPEADRSMIAVTVLGFAIAAVVLIIAVLFISGVLTRRSPSSKNTSKSQPAAEAESSLKTADGKVKVPDITGKTASEAQSILKKAHLGLKFGGEQASNQEEGQIISQNPKSGASVDEYSTVVYVRSSGPEQVDFPDETGNYLTDAKAELMNMGFGHIEVEQKHSSKALGTVIATTPAADRKTTTTEKVVLTVSIGEKSKTAYTGNYLDLTASNAAAEAAKDGIICDVTYGESDLVDTGHVMSQDIEPGSQVASGTLLTLTVNEKKPDDGELEGSTEEGEADSTNGNESSGKKTGTSDSVTLNGPANYEGGTATFVLTQEKDGKEYQIVEKTTDTASFPMQISLKKVIGVSEGTLWLYEGAGSDMTRRASWKIS